MEQESWKAFNELNELAGGVVCDSCPLISVSGKSEIGKARTLAC